MLLEKPGVLTKREALDLQMAAREHNVVLFEAFHWRYHPAAKRVLEIVNGGEIGVVEGIDAVSAMFDPKSWWSPTVGDRGRVKLLDRWCYLVDEMFYFLNGGGDGDGDDGGSGYDVEVDYVDLSTSRIQVKMTGSFFNRTVYNVTDDGDDVDNNRHVVTINFDAYKDKVELPQWYVTIHGTKGSVKFNNVIFPFIFHSIEVTNDDTNEKRIEYKYDDDDDSGGGGSSEWYKKKRTTTFEFQLDEFVKAVREHSRGTTCSKEGGGEDTCTHRNSKIRTGNVNIQQMIRNADLYEKIVSYSGQQPLKSW